MVHLIGGDTVDSCQMYMVTSSPTTVPLVRFLFSQRHTESIPISTSTMSFPGITGQGILWWLLRKRNESCVCRLYCCFQPAASWQRTHSISKVALWSLSFAFHRSLWLIPTLPNHTAERKKIADTYRYMPNSIRYLRPPKWMASSLSGTGSYYCSYHTTLYTRYGW